MSRIIHLNATELDRTRSCKVVDQYQDTKYLILGKWGLIGDAFSIYSVKGDVVAEIRQRSVGSTPQFDVYFMNQFVGRTTVYFSFRYLVIFIHGISWTVTGNEFKQTYTIRHGRHTIAKIKSFEQSTQVIRLITVGDIKQEPLVLAIVAIIQHPVLANLSKLNTHLFDHPQVKGSLGTDVQQFKK